MAGVAEKRATRGDRLENSSASFDSQIFFDAATVRDVADQGFADVRVEIVTDDPPGGIGVGADDLVEVFQKVFFGARFT